MIHAVIALRSGDAGKAVEALAAAAPYELGQHEQCFTFALYTVYLRGEAYLAAKQGAAAAVEFQKILDHPGVVINDPIGALAHLGLGRAYASSRRHRESQNRLPGFPRALEKRRPGHPDPSAGQSRIRKAEVV